MKQHPARLEKAGITPERYRELQAICRQYGQYKREIRRMRAGIVDAPRRGTGKWQRPDPTGNQAARLADLLAWRAERVKLIERCAHAVAPEAVARALLRCVTTGASWESLSPPCGARQFYDMRLSFFIAFDAMLSDRECL